MSSYSIALFLHIVGTLGLFAGISLEQAGLRGLRRASTTAALREWLTLMSVRGRIEGPSNLVLLATGVYMVATASLGRQAWISLGLLGLLLIALLGAVVTGRTVRALLSALPTDDQPVRTALRQRIDSPVLRTSAALRATLALAIVFNMAVKPHAQVAVLALGIALFLGALAPWLGRRGSLAAHEYGAEH